MKPVYERRGVAERFLTGVMFGLESLRPTPVHVLSTVISDICMSVRDSVASPHGGGELSSVLHFRSAPFSFVATV